MAQSLLASLGHGTHGTQLCHKLNELRYAEVGGSQVPTASRLEAACPFPIQAFWNGRTSTMSNT